MAYKNFGKDSTLMAEFRSLLVSNAAQRIQFRFGAFELLSLDFRHLAAKLAEDASSVTIHVDEDKLKKLGALAGYNPGSNTFIFQNEHILRDPVGRSEALHEAVHAIIDLRDRAHMSLASEAICFLAGAMYFVTAGQTASFPAKDNHRLLELAIAVHARSASRVPQVSLAERLELRKILRKNYGYKRGVDGRSHGFESQFR